MAADKAKRLKWPVSHKTLNKSRLLRTLTFGLQRAEKNVIRADSSSQAHSVSKMFLELVCSIVPFLAVQICEDVYLNRADEDLAVVFEALDLSDRQSTWAYELEKCTLTFTKTSNRLCETTSRAPQTQTIVDFRELVEIDAASASIGTAYRFKPLDTIKDEYKELRRAIPKLTEQQKKSDSSFASAHAIAFERLQAAGIVSRKSSETCEGIRLFEMGESLNFYLVVPPDYRDVATSAFQNIHNLCK